jgi:outer membrane protein insertion porin family
MNFRTAATLAALLLPCLAQAMEPFTVRDIRVEGIQRTEAGTVFNYLPVKVGDTLDADRATAAVKALFATGFFKDVRLETRDDVLIVVVEERPAIAQLDFNGIKEFDKDELKKGLKQVGLAEGRIFDRAMLDQADQELKRQYFSRGKYAVKITTTVTPLERNRVGIHFDVVEGEVAKIREINIVGANAYTEKALRKRMTMSTPGWLTWFTKNDQYSKQKLSADLETIRSQYLNNGYLEFNIDSTQVAITPDKKDIHITVNLTEGDQYTVSDIKLAGNLVVPEAELMPLVSIKPGDIFARERLTESTKRIGDRLGNDGYAFANVNAVPDLDREKHTAAFTFLVDPGRRVYVNRVNIAGNTRTRDEVVRREVRQMEGAWYDAGKINRSRERLNRLDYFEEVNVETPAVPGTTDQVDVNYGLTEKATGNVLLGLGFSSSEGLVLSGSITQSNLFGSGNRMALQINSGSVNTVYALSYTNPYWTLDGLGLGFDLYKRDVDSTSLDGVSNYQTSTTGLGSRLSWPIGETESINFGMSYDRTVIGVDASSPPQYINYVATFGEDNDTARLEASWARDTRDSLTYPTKGRLQRISSEWATPLGSLQYYKVNYQHQYFWPVTQSVSLLLNGELGLGGGLAGKPLPFFRNFYAGGNNTVRGFDTATLGPKVLNTDGTISSLGGESRVVGNIELLFPFPGAAHDKSLRMSLFTDLGGVFGPDDYQGRYESFNIDDLRYSAGLAVAWFSPLGPLKFSLAHAINPAEDDETAAFQFALGTTF